MPAALVVIVAVTAGGAALMAGAFWVFSVMVMPGLSRTEPTSAVAAMQQINVVAIRPAFLGVFIGTAVACAGAGIWAIVAWSSASPWIVVAAVYYLLGAIAVTAAGNVPLNNALTAVSATSSAAALEGWRSFASRWVPWNHARAVASSAAAGCLLAALAV
jgi:uncharacterized membrane protein